MMFCQLKHLAGIPFKIQNVSKGCKVIERATHRRTFFHPSLKYSSHCQDETPQKYSVISFYQFQKIERPEESKKELETFLKSLGATGRIYLNKIGINAQMCLQTCHVDTFKLFISKMLGQVELKTQFYDKPVYPKLRLRNGKLLEGLSEDFDASCGGRHVSAEQWDQMLDQNDENTLVLDVRNGYEWDVGHFEGAQRPKFTQFNAFSAYADELASEHGGEKPRVMMYCTGGIRCELFSVMLKERGFESVYQLDGGVLKYGAESSKHWRGGLFVFDDRMVVPLQGQATREVISGCRHCGTTTDMMYNCAHTACNELFACCRDCADQHRGCCSEECRDACWRPFKTRNRHQWHPGRPTKAIGRGQHCRDFLKEHVIDGSENK